MHGTTKLNITRLGCCLEDDYPSIDWTLHAQMANIWLEIDELHKTGQSVEYQTSTISYQLRLNQRFSQVDCINMVGGLAISERARIAFDSLSVPGMRFLEFKINGEPFYNFHTERCLDCLDKKHSEIQYFESSPERVMQVDRYVFMEERIKLCDLFTVPELSDGMFFWSQETFLTEEARQAIEQFKLIGFRFEKLPE